MAAPIPFDELAVDLLGARPTLGGAEDNHGPRRTTCRAALPVVALYLGDAVQTLVERGCELLMHRRRVIASDDVGLMTVPTEEGDQLVIRNAIQDRRVRDLVAVE